MVCGNNSDSSLQLSKHALTGLADNVVKHIETCLSVSSYHVDQIMLDFISNIIVNILVIVIFMLLFSLLLFLLSFLLLLLL